MPRSLGVQLSRSLNVQKNGKFEKDLVSIYIQCFDMYVLRL